MKIQNGVLISISNNDIKYGKIKIPNKVTHIGDWAFDGCTGLTALTLPESLTHIGDWAFRGCTGLTALTLPESLTHIGGGAFRGCTGLTALTLPESLTHIGDWAFDGCTGLTALPLKYFKQEDTYKVKCVDGMLMHILSHRNFNDSIEIYKAQHIAGMRDKKLILKDCYVAEQSGAFAHGDTLKTAVADLNFKIAADRGRAQYRHVGIDDVVEFEEAVAMYRIITGACQFGTEQFIKTIGEPQETYTPREIIKMTDGQYGHRAFAEFWDM